MNPKATQQSTVSSSGSENSVQKAAHTSSCPACLLVSSEPSHETFYSFTLHACPHCGLHYWEPRNLPDSGWYQRMYHGRDVRLMPLEPGHRLFLRDPKAPRAGSLLDIGCGTGNFLVAAQKAGYAVTGTELDPSAARFASEKCGLPRVLSFTLAQFVDQYPDEKFDVVTFFEVLEHQADPFRFLSNARSCLRPGGCIALSVPNRRRWRVGLDPIDYPPNHFLRWDAPSLRRFLEAQGFEILTLYEQPAGISYTAQMINVSLRTGISRAVVPDLPPVFRDTIQEKGDWDMQASLRDPSARRRIFEALSSVKFAACFPLAVLWMPVVRLRGYRDAFLYCLARKKD